jgi:HK97 gp10 family phage protein
MTVVVKLDATRLDRIIAQLPAKADQTVRAGAEAVQGKAATLAPVDTGALKNSIHTSKQGNLMYEVADGVEYGYFQEMGTSRMAAHPFMVPAVEWVRPQYNASWRNLFEAL